MPLVTRNLTNLTPPRLRYAAIAQHVLGQGFKSEISLAFVGRAQVRALNKIYRGKDEPANILTFPLSPRDGEILICLSVAQSAARRAGAPFSEYLRHLFIHGLLHLKGLTHGSRMEALERRIITFFTRYGQSHRYRTRHRHRVDQGRSL